MSSPFFDLPSLNLSASKMILFHIKLSTLY
uniref:Uncharacterized protein n=1 Tax=Anguilla anguilla TaxID=7936 RepID=A0A0E9TBT7_ANGAN